MLLSTTLDLCNVRTNVGTTAVFAIVGNREVLIGESPSIGSKRARIEVLTVADPNVGSGRALAANLARLEREDRAYWDAKNEAWEASMIEEADRMDEALATALETAEYRPNSTALAA